MGKRFAVVLGVGIALMLGAAALGFPARVEAKAMACSGTWITTAGFVDCGVGVVPAQNDTVTLTITIDLNGTTIVCAGNVTAADLDTMVVKFPAGCGTFAGATQSLTIGWTQPVVAVGGIAEPVTLSGNAPSESAGGSGPSADAIAAIAGGAAAVVAAGVAGGWYARRRWLR